MQQNHLRQYIIDKNFVEKVIKLSVVRISKVRLLLSSVYKHLSHKINVERTDQSKLNFSF